MDQCENCMYYDYDEDNEEYYCMVDLDQDDYERFLRQAQNHCPMFRFCDDYTLARKQ